MIFNFYHEIFLFCFNIDATCEWSYYVQSTRPSAVMQYLFCAPLYSRRLVSYKILCISIL